MRPALRWVLVGGLLVGAGLAIWRLRPAPPGSEPPPVVGQVPAFTLVDQDGESFGSRDLHGKPYVACFFFTSCTTVCPKLMGAMSRLLDDMKAAELDARILSITVDPQNDTPAKMRAYGEKLGVDFRRWSLLTGPPATVDRLVREGFLTGVGQRPPAGGGPMEIAHGGHLVLVDGDGQIRGLFGSDDGGLSAALAATKRLGGGS